MGRLRDGGYWFVLGDSCDLFELFLVGVLWLWGWFKHLFYQQKVIVQSQSQHNFDNNIITIIQQEQLDRLPYYKPQQNQERVCLDYNHPTCQIFIVIILRATKNMQQSNKGPAFNRQDEYEPSIAQSNVRSVVSHSSFQNLYKQFKEYQTRSPILDIEKLRASEHLKLKKFRESVYYGEIVNGKRHGQGIMLYNNDRLYEGNWENDFKQGAGYEQFANGSVYQGIYVNGKPEGVGKYSWPNGQFYQGEWLNGLKHGSGMWQGCKGDSYIGEWRMSKAEGYGVHVWVNGDRYEGEFKQCLKHGQGTQKFANGDLYKGQYQRGKPNGYGEYYWQNGSYFKGNFKDGLRQGHGMWKKGPGASDKYEGEYLSDKKHGYGIFTWATGNIYKGHYQQDLRTGYGEMYWNDGSYYKGQWQKGVQNGQGLIYTPKEGIKKGKFKNNVLVQIEAEQPAPANQGLNNNATKAGSIHKNSGIIHKNSGSIPPLDATKQAYKSMDNKRRLISMYENSDKKGQTKVNRQLNPLIPKKGDKKVNRITNTVDLQRMASNPAYNRSKDRIPHSAFYMHKLHKRVSTANNQDRSMQVRNKGEVQVRNKGEVLDQLRNFTKKMAGRRG